MRVSSRTKYAILALVELSKIPFGQSIKIGEIAKRQRIPQRFLEVILSQLKHGGVVDSKRGADGGYQLARPASQITVSKIFSILGTERKVTEEHSDPMLVPARFILVNLWNKVDKAVDEILDSTTIEHLATEEERMRLGTSPMYII